MTISHDKDYFLIAGVPISYITELVPTLSTDIKRGEGEEIKS